MKNVKIVPFVLGLISLVAFQSCWNLARVNPPCPTISKISPDGGRFNDTITVTGTGFLKGLPKLYTVAINGVDIPQDNILSVPNEQTLIFKVPKGGSNGQLTVRIKDATDCQSSQGVAFNYYFTATKVSVFFGIQVQGFGTCATLAAPNTLFQPAGLDVDNAGNVAIADKLNQRIRVVAPSVSDPTEKGNLTKTFGKSSCSTGCDSLPTISPVFNLPNDVDFDQSNDLYVMEESGNATMRVIRASNLVEIFVGKCSTPVLNPPDAPRTTARLQTPIGVYKDGNDIYFTDAGHIRKIDVNGMVTSFVAKVANTEYRGIEVSKARENQNQGPIFVTDALGKSIKFFSFSKGQGQGTVPIRNSNIAFNRPIAMAIDSKGNIFVADESANRVFVIYPNGELAVLAGTGTPGFTDGLGSQAQFNKPSGIAIDESRKIVYVSDALNNVVRSIKIE